MPSKWQQISQGFVTLLMIDAAIIAYRLFATHTAPWRLIAVYWLLLTCKNATEWIGTLNRGINNRRRGK